MIIYCDTLTLRACLHALRLRFFAKTSSGKSHCNIKVLDPITPLGWQVIYRSMMALLRFKNDDVSFQRDTLISCHVVFCTVMKLLRFKVEEVDFQCGLLKTRENIVVGAAARQTSGDIALKSAERIVNRSLVLSSMNRKWGRNTIVIHITKSLYNFSFYTVLRIMVAEALTRDAFEEDAYLIVSCHPSLDTEIVSNLAPKIGIYFYWSLTKMLIVYLREIGRFFYWRVSKIKRLIRNIIKIDPGGYDDYKYHSKELSSLLLLQEDDLSMDRSYRTQPHWLFGKRFSSNYRTIVVKTREDFSFSNSEVLKENDVVSMTYADIFAPYRTLSSNPVKRRLRKDLWTCISRIIFSPLSESIVMLYVYRLINCAFDMVDFCRHFKVKAFMTSENYISLSDAIQLIASDLDIRTYSYQYSNLRTSAVTMLTPADVMFVFSDLYQKRWAFNGFGPKSFVNIGYVYDSSFKLIKERASLLRLQLKKAGARFIICYFDETILHGKYAVITEREHEAELLSLLEFVLNDSSIGLVVKSQFHRNSPGNLKHMKQIVESAKATGRYTELLHGIHRNTVFPAEAALCADIAIGSTVGATASLEAALVGVRSILLNQYGLKSDNDYLYSQEDIVYSSMNEALNSIRDFRAGVKKSAGLGDWSSIINHFDSYRDGNAGYRMRDLLENAVLR